MAEVVIAKIKKFLRLKDESDNLVNHADDPKLFEGIDLLLLDNSTEETKIFKAISWHDKENTTPEGS